MEDPSIVMAFAKGMAAHREAVDRTPWTRWSAVANQPFNPFATSARFGDRANEAWAWDLGWRLAQHCARGGGMRCE